MFALEKLQKAQQANRSFICLGLDLDPKRMPQEFAGSVRDKTWLGLSEEQVRRLYSWVAEQCKAPSSPR